MADLHVYKPIEERSNVVTYGGYNYVQGGAFYDSVNMPLSTARDVNLQKENYVNVSEKKTAADTKNLKAGVSQKVNIFGLIDMGDAGIHQAAKEGHITKIHYVETKQEKVYMPLVFIPIYFTRLVTTVYGE